MDRHPGVHAETRRGILLILLVVARLGASPHAAGAELMIIGNDEKVTSISETSMTGTCPS